MAPLPSCDVDLARYIRPGDRVVVGQGSAEPQTLARLLVEQRHRLGGIEVFVGPGLSDVFAGAETEGLSFQSYGALGTVAGLEASGRLDVVPMSYGRLCAAFGSGALRADVVMLQVAALPGRGYSLGLSDDYAAAARGRARVVMLEVNPGTPWTWGTTIPLDAPGVVCVAGEAPPLQLAPPGLDGVDRAIAALVAGLVPDRATVQVGVGTLPHAVMVALRGHAGLGIHSGVLGDAGRVLIETGVATGAHKGVDAGIAVTNTVFGSRALYEWVHDRPAVQVRAAAYTHSLGVMARLHRFTAINGGVEVDLGGQVNTEVAPGLEGGGRYIGALGGGLEFTRGAALSEGGRAIVALRSTAREGLVGRIVPRVAVATIPRADVDTVVTEHGVAELRGVTLRVRARRLIAIAAPHLREDLARAASVMEGCAA